MKKTNKHTIPQQHLENCYYLFTMSVPIESNTKTGFKSSIVSSIFLKEFKFDKEKILEQMLKMNLNLKFVYISALNKKNIETFESRHGYSKITCDVVSLKYFFSNDGLGQYFLYSKNDNFEVVFCIKGLDWASICGRFALLFIDISGGSNTKKHMLSPHQFRLSQFLICFYGNDVPSIINESFHRQKTENDKKNLNLSYKKIQNSIIDLVEYSKSASEKQLISSKKELENKNMDKVTTTSSPAQGCQPIERSLAKKATPAEPSSDEHTTANPRSGSKTIVPNINAGKKYINKKGKGDTREFHTSACIFYSEASGEQQRSHRYQNTRGAREAEVLVDGENKSSKRKAFVGVEINKNLIAPQPPKIKNDSDATVQEQSIIMKQGNKKTNIKGYLEYVKELTSEIKIDNNNEKKRYENQLDFENTWLNLITENIKNDDIFINKFHNKLFSCFSEAAITLDSMAKSKYLKKKFHKLGEELNKIEYLILTFSICISLYSRLSYNAIAIKIGKDILYLNYKNIYLKNKKKITDECVEFISFDDYQKSLEIDKKFYVKLGDFFMTLLQTYPHDLFHREVTLDSYYTKEPFLLKLNNDYLEDIKKNIILNPTTLPMLCRPKQWSNKEYGGFLSNNYIHKDIITGIEDFSHKIENKDSLYKAVNYLNSIQFAVNSNLLDYLMSPEGSYILEAIKPEDELQREFTLSIAKFYKNIYFYLNTNTDWRGRIYTQSFYLSYQSGDLSTALLNFWEGEPISEEGLVYLYIYGANCHNENGISKSSFNDRIKWVKNNYDKIINLDKDLILSAELPFVFTAFCLNMKEIHNNPKAIIKTPVFLDATCSGIQHLSALMHDLELGVNTNLLASTNDQKPEDIYSLLLKPINQAINKYGKENIDYCLLSLVELGRKEVKTSIMTKVYNVTVYGISQQLQSSFKKIVYENTDLDENQPIIGLQENLIKSLKTKKNKIEFICSSNDERNGKGTVTLTKKDIFKIASIINDQIFAVFPSLNSIYNFFIDIAKITIKLGIPLTWITPSGLKITQRYLKKKKIVVPLSIFGKTKKLVLTENDDSLDSIKQQQAIIPNIIHSLDASHLINLIKTSSEENFRPLITIHDCFGTLPNKMGELDWKVRKEFVLLYTDSKFLNDFHQRFIQSITDNQFVIKTENNKFYIILENNEKIEIPSIPKLGELDIKNIMNSKYMIS